MENLLQEIKFEIKLLVIEVFLQMKVRAMCNTVIALRHVLLFYDTSYI